MDPREGDDGPGGPEEPRRPTGPPRGPAPRRRRGALGPTLAVLAVLVFLGSIGSQLFTDLWWYDSVGFKGVFTTRLATQVLLFVLAFLVTAGVVAASLVAAYRTRPLYVPTTPGQQVLEQYREALQPLRRLAVIAIPAVLGILAGSTAMGSWQSYLLWRNAEPFGKKDAQFGMDIGFFVFTLPWLRFVVGFLTVVLVLGLIAAVFTHYVYGGLQLPGRGPSTRAAFIHVAVLAAALALVRAASLWLDRYSLTTQDGGLVSDITGFTYTADQAVLPTKAILAAASIMCAGFFVAAIWTRSWRLPVIGVGLLVALSVVVGMIYPAVIQSLQVNPSQKTLEKPYIQRNIDATLAAFGLDQVQTSPSPAATSVKQGQLRADAESIPGIRLIDPNVVSPSFRQLESFRQYYGFPDTLDVDRYHIGSQRTDAVVAVREVNLDGVTDRNWLNDHTVYTHGSGLVGAYGNRLALRGDPVFFPESVTGNPVLGTYEPRVYFGEMSPDYSIVGDAPGAEPREFDYIDDKGSSNQRNNTYAGKGGVHIGGFFAKAAYAVKYREPKLILSDAVNDHSRILDHREPKERVERVAPWLTLDGNAFPTVIDGRIVWVLDGYTTSGDYPGSKLVDLADATADSVSERSSVVRTSEGRVNYMRNSVKATVDAYDGAVTLYAWDGTDPLLKAWSKAFPGSVKPLSQMDGQLMSHVRYPQDLLKVQRQLLTKYHVTNPESFYGGQDFWRVPKDPAHAVQDQPTYYQSIAMPDQTSPAFSLTTTFGPTGTREILRAFLAVDSDAGSTAGTKAPSYGKIRILEMPPQSSIEGPGQVQNRIETSTVRSQSQTESLNLRSFINQSKTGGGVLTYGNLLTLPVGDGLLYVQPIYVQASRDSGGSIPQVKAVAAVFGTTVAWGETLDQALNGLFGGTSGVGTGGTDPGGSSGTDGTTKPQGTDVQQLAAAIRQMQQAQSEASAALKKGDFAAYGAAQKKLQAAIDAAATITPRLQAKSAPAPSPTGSAAPSATASPSAR